MNRVLFLSGGAREHTLDFLLKNGINIVGVITPFPSKRNNRFSKVVETAEHGGIPVEYVNKENLCDTIQKYNADILLSCGFSFVISDEVINHFKYAINVHPTLLPKYRGYRSGPYILINGEKESGVTVHFLNEELDKGDIILQEKFDVSVFDTPRSLKRKTDNCEKGVVLGALQMLENGKFNCTKQDERRASTYDYMRTPKDSEINWNKSLKSLYNQIRACDSEDYPAFFFVDGEKVCIKLWRESKPDDEKDMI